MTLMVGLDLGERRIGVAVADSGGPPRPLATILRGATVSADVAALRRVLPGPPDEVVVGLPIDMSGGEGAQAAATRAWVRELEAALEQELGVPVPVRLRDERLTSHLAEERLGPMKRGRSGGPPTPAQRRTYRERVDREAAAILLEDELQARAVSGGAGSVAS